MISESELKFRDLLEGGNGTIIFGHYIDTNNWVKFHSDGNMTCGAGYNLFSIIESIWTNGTTISNLKELGYIWVSPGAKAIPGTNRFRRKPDTILIKIFADISHPGGRWGCKFYGPMPSIKTRHFWENVLKAMPPEEFWDKLIEGSELRDQINEAEG